MYEGFFIAFVVGLIVNQMTEILNISKGVDTSNYNIVMDSGFRYSNNKSI